MSLNCNDMGLSFTGDTETVCGQSRTPNQLQCQCGVHTIYQMTEELCMWHDTRTAQVISRRAWSQCMWYCKQRGTTPLVLLVNGPAPICTMLQACNNQQTRHRTSETSGSNFNLLLENDSTNRSSTQCIETQFSIMTDLFCWRTKCCTVDSESLLVPFAGSFRSPGSFRGIQCRAKTGPTAQFHI